MSLYPNLQIKETSVLEKSGDSERHGAELHTGEN